MKNYVNLTNLQSLYLINSGRRLFAGNIELILFVIAILILCTGHGGGGILNINFYRI